ncbi:hypothetical protein G9A89_009244 [Geosiphon pyriformis]|nr:hypothetical protein G9A89_009244 [Geosiphon pyriformis]
MKPTLPVMVDIKKSNEKELGGNTGGKTAAKLVPFASLKFGRLSRAISELKEKVHPWIVNRFSGAYVFISSMNSGYLGSGVAVIMDNSLAKYVYKINFLITKAVNKFSFIILGGEFNENSSYRCANYNKCFDLDLINSLGGGSCNSCGVIRVIDYLFISSNLVNLIVSYSMTDVVDYFDTDYKAIAVSFARAVTFSDLDAMWAIVCKILVFLANSTFSKKWFKSFDEVFIKESFKFYKLELLVSKLAKASCLASSKDFASLLKTWDRLDNDGMVEVKFLFISGSSFDAVCSELAKAKKSYCSSKLLELRHVEEFCIKQVICKRIENFELDKNHIIRNILEHSFCKVVLDYLVMDKKLVLEPELVKSKVDTIMEG